MKTIEELRTAYNKIVRQLEKGNHNDSVKLPKYAAVFQYAIFDRLKKLAELHENKSELIYDLTYNTKLQATDISTVAPSASEAKTLISTSKEVRKINRAIEELENESKLLEEMITTIKGHSFNMSNYMKGKELYE